MSLSPPIAEATDLRIGGWRKTSFIDYPGKLAAVVFTQGCNLRCPYCHNAELVDGPPPTGAPSQAEVLRFLEQRRNTLGGIVVTGGEPTLQRGLLPFLRSCRERGYAIKLDTNGTRPLVLADILGENLVDFIAMDVKASSENYANAAGCSPNLMAIQTSIEMIIGSSVAHEFRTTLADGLHQTDELAAIGDRLRGCQRWVVQRFRAGRTLNRLLPLAAPDSTLLECAEAIAKARCIPFLCR